MSKQSLTSDEARRKSEERVRRRKEREGEAHSAYENLAKRWKAELVKTERLRALRLAKEAAEDEQLRRTKPTQRDAASKAAEKPKTESV